MKFEIHAAEVRLHHLNVRTESHGPDEVTAIDLGLIWETGNEVLAQFHPSLRRLLYSAAPATQPEVDGVEEVLPVRTFTELAPLHWSDEAAGLTLAMHHALGEGLDIVIAEAKADSFVLAAMEGGTVKVAFRVRAVCSDERALGRLPLLLKRILPMTLTAAKDTGKGATGSLLHAVGTA
jgi:hypothetical protein